MHVSWNLPKGFVARKEQREQSLAGKIKRVNMACVIMESYKWNRKASYNRTENSHECNAFQSDFEGLISILNNIRFKLKTKKLFLAEFC